ncbi:MAG: DUF6712 family protein [Muribaculaceae bacterium]
MITITKNKFESYVVSATNATAEVFEMLTQEIKSAEDNLVMDIIGDIVYKTIETYNENLQKECERYICLLAFKNAMPSLDLVLTPTGFGVVNNQNVAPASLERVSKLSISIAKSLDDCTENIYMLLRGDANWCESHQSKSLFTSIIWHSRILRGFGYPDANLSWLRAKANIIAVAEGQIKKKISHEFYSELCSALRQKNETEMQKIVIHYIQGAICCIIDAPNGISNRIETSLFHFLDCNISEFPTYKLSSAYEANHFTPHANEKEDSCFFWG